MICKLRAEIDQDPPRVDILNWMNYTTFDITGDLMFGESFDCLKDTRMHPWISLLFNSIKTVAIVGAAMQFLTLHVLLEACIPTKVTRQAEEHFNLAAKKVDRRLEANISRPDFISAILQNGLSEIKGQYCDRERIMSRAEIHSNAFMYGGFQTIYKQDNGWGNVNFDLLVSSSQAARPQPRAYLAASTTCARTHAP